MEPQIKDYYNDHIEDFQLKEDVVKLNYVKIRHIAPNIDFLIDTYHSLDSNNLEELESYCLQFAERFFLGDVDWISWSLFSKQLPLERDYPFKDVKKRQRAVFTTSGQ